MDFIASIFHEPHYYSRRNLEIFHTEIYSSLKKRGIYRYVQLFVSGLTEI